MSRKVRTVAAMSVAALLVGAAANAGTVKSGIFRYVTKTATLSSATTQGQTEAQCPDGTTLTGVGGSLPSSKDGDLTAIMPLDGQDEDGDANDLSVANGRWASGQGKIKIKSVAACSHAPDITESIAHVTANGTVPANGTASLVAPCPNVSDRALGGGGGAQDPDVSLLGSYLPSTSQWQIDVANASASIEPISTTIACLPDGVRGVFYDEELVQVPPVGTLNVKMPCPAGTKVSGGGFAGSGSTTVRSSRPYDGKDRDTAPDDGWSVRSVNPNGAQQENTMFLICVGAPIV